MDWALVLRAARCHVELVDAGRAGVQSLAQFPDQPAREGHQFGTAKDSVPNQAVDGAGAQAASIQYLYLVARDGDDPMQILAGFVNRFVNHFLFLC